MENGMNEPDDIPKELRPVMESLITAMRSAEEALREVIDANDRRLLDMRYALRAADERLKNEGGRMKPEHDTWAAGMTSAIRVVEWWGKCHADRLKPFPGNHVIACEVRDIESLTKHLERVMEERMKGTLNTEHSTLNI